jgi:hypothetical protein
MMMMHMHMIRLGARISALKSSIVFSEVASFSVSSATFLALLGFLGHLNTSQYIPRSSFAKSLHWVRDTSIFERAGN